MRRCAAWLVPLPIALVGVEAAHALANAAFGAPEGREEVFASAASGAEFVPVLSASALALVLVGVVGRVTGGWRLPRDARRLALAFACLPPTLFVFLELMEALLNGGQVAPQLLAEPAFLAGLALQIPFGFVGYLTARLLLRVSDGIRSLILRRRATVPLGCPGAHWWLPRDHPFARVRRGCAHLGRAPPVGLHVSG